MTGQKAKKILEEYRPEIDKYINDFFKIELAAAKKIDPIIYHNVKALEKLVLYAGKRLRPILTILAYKAAGGKNDKEIRKVAVAIEMFHVFLLIHDDICDRDDLRHGVDTLHEVYRKYHRQKKLLGDSEHFGNSIALLIGDIASYFANKIIIESNFSADKRLKALDQLSRAMVNTGYGQIFDVLSSAQRKVSEMEVLRIHYYKTAKYTIENPLLVGNLLAGGKANISEKISQYAIPLGIAFQIQDDILGMFADEKKLGKPVGSDLREGKHTLLVTEVMSRAIASQKRQFKLLLGKKDLTKTELADARDIIESSGSLDHSKKLAYKYAKKAMLAGQALPIRKKEKNFLEGIARYIVERKL